MACSEAALGVTRTLGKGSYPRVESIPAQNSMMFGKFELRLEGFVVLREKFELHSVLT